MIFMRASVGKNEVLCSSTRVEKTMSIPTAVGLQYCVEIDDNRPFRGGTGLLFFFPAGEHPAAMQHGNSSNSAVTRLLPIFLLFVCHSFQVLLVTDVYAPVRAVKLTAR